MSVLEELEVREAINTSNLSSEMKERITEFLDLFTETMEAMREEDN